MPEGGHDCFCADEKLFHVNEICEDITPGWTCSPENTVFEEGKGCVDINECLTECIPDDVKIASTKSSISMQSPTSATVTVSRTTVQILVRTLRVCFIESPCTGFGSQCTNNFGSYDCACNEPGTNLKMASASTLTNAQKELLPVTRFVPTKRQLKKIKAKVGILCVPATRASPQRGRANLRQYRRVRPPGIDVDPPCDVNAEWKTRG